MQARGNHSLPEPGDGAIVTHFLSEILDRPR